MIVLPNASATVKTMFGSILDPTVANLTKVPLIPLKLQQLILLNSILLKPWVLSSSQHEVRIDNQQSPKRKKIDMIVVQKIIVLVKDEKDQSFNDEVDEETGEGSLLSF